MNQKLTDVVAALELLCEALKTLAVESEPSRSNSSPSASPTLEHQNSRWTEEQDETLRRMYPGCSDLDALALLMQRKVGGLYNRAHVLGLSSHHAGHSRLAWTEENDQILRDEWPTIVDVFELARRLHRTVPACIVRAQRLGIERNEDNS